MSISIFSLYDQSIFSISKHSQRTLASSVKNSVKLVEPKKDIRLGVIRARRSYGCLTFTYSLLITDFSALISNLDKVDNSSNIPIKLALKAIKLSLSMLIFSTEDRKSVV